MGLDASQASRCRRMASRSNVGTSSCPMEPFRLPGRDVLPDRILLLDRIVLKLLFQRRPRAGVEGGESASTGAVSSVLNDCRGFDSSRMLLRLPILRSSRAIRSRAEPAGRSVEVSSSSGAAGKELSTGLSREV